MLRITRGRVQAVHQFFKGNALLPPLATRTVDDAEEAPSSVAGEQQAQKEQRGRQGQQKEQQGGKAAHIKVVWQPAGGAGGRGGTAPVEGAGGGGRGGGRAGGRGQGRGGRGGGAAQQEEQAWGGGPGERFIKFVLYKENMDTQVRLQGKGKGPSLHSAQPSTRLPPVEAAAAPPGCVLLGVRAAGAGHAGQGAAPGRPHAHLGLRRHQGQARRHHAGQRKFSHSAPHHRATAQGASSSVALLLLVLLCPRCAPVAAVCDGVPAAPGHAGHRQLGPLVRGTTSMWPPTRACAALGRAALSSFGPLCVLASARSGADATPGGGGRARRTRVLRAPRRVRGIKVGSFSYTSQELQLGSLLGNRFQVRPPSLAGAPPLRGKPSFPCPKP